MEEENGLSFEDFLENESVNLAYDAENFDSNKWEEETQKQIDEELEVDDDYDGLYDLDEKQDTNMWPENLINEIFGLDGTYPPEFRGEISNYFRSKPKVKKNNRYCD